MDKKFVTDAVERVAWTAIEAGLAALAVHVSDAPTELIPLLTAGLALLKSIVARHVGDTTSAQIPLWVTQAVEAASAEAVDVIATKAKRNRLQK